jgi:hypothetical protein
VTAASTVPVCADTDTCLCCNLRLHWKEELLEHSRDRANYNEDSEVGARTRRGTGMCENFWKGIIQRRKRNLPKKMEGNFRKDDH